MKSQKEFPLPPAPGLLFLFTIFTDSSLRSLHTQITRLKSKSSQHAPNESPLTLLTCANLFFFLCSGTLPFTPRFISRTLLIRQEWTSYDCKHFSHPQRAN